MIRLHHLGLLAAMAALPAAAQESACPPLPAGSQLQWQAQPGDGFLVCRAVDGERTVLGMMLTQQPTLDLKRRNREEQGSIGLHEVRWYQPEIAVDTGVRKRVTIVELGNNRYAQVWVDAASDEELQRLLLMAEGIALH